MAGYAQTYAEGHRTRDFPPLPPLLIHRYVDEVDEGGCTALMRAAASGSARVVSLLHERGARLTTPRHDGMTPLMLAARPGHKRVVHELLKLLDAESINAQRPKDGATALLLACRNGEEEVALMLMQRGAALEHSSTDTYGETALLAACRVGEAAIASNLLAFGASPHPVNAAGMTAFALAKQAFDIVETQTEDLGRMRITASELLSKLSPPLDPQARSQASRQ